MTILSSLSQEEARSISENVTWGLRKKFADGKFSVGYSRFLGYDKGEDGNLAINEEQAKTVRLIFGLFIEGLTPYAIAKELTRRGIITVTGQSKWNQATINNVLRNEKYAGMARIQKTFTPDFLTKKAVKNNGQVPSYFVEQSHPAIIAPATFEMVQTEIVRRKQEGRRYSGVSIFSGKIKCGECGGSFGAKVWHSNDKYRRVVYQCNYKFAGVKKCSTPHLVEDEIKTVFIKAVSKLLKGKADMLENIRLVQEKICTTEALEVERKRLMGELQVLSDMVQNCINENARIAQNQTDYQQRYNELVSRYDATKARYDEVEKFIKARRLKAERLDNFAKAIKAQDSVVTEFDEGLWGTLVDFMTVYGKDDIGVTFKDGTEIRIS